MLRFFLGLCLAVAVTFQLWAESAGGLTWTAPTGWKSQGSRPMRAATYTVLAAEGDPEDGECVAYYFGPGQGGSVEANVQRWIGQFRTADGGPADDAAKTSTRTINGIHVTLVDVTGTYMFKPFPRAPKATPKPGYRMLAAIAEGPKGNVFFKLTAPRKTADEAEAAFQKMLGSFRR